MHGPALASRVGDRTAPHPDSATYAAATEQKMHDYATISLRAHVNAGQRAATAPCDPHYRARFDIRRTPLLPSRPVSAGSVPFHSDTVMLRMLKPLA